MSALRAPWKFTYDPSTISGGVRAKGGGYVCQVWSGRKPSEAMVRANGALIAAAPDLLAACQFAQAMEDNRRAGVVLSDTDFSELHDRLARAIAKAAQ